LQTGSNLTTTIGSMNPGITRRQACDSATSLIEDYGNTVPEGKTSRRWQPKTIAGVAAQIEMWFDLQVEPTKLSISPGALIVARRVFIEACLDHNITGLAIQAEDWYTELAQKTKADRKAARSECQTMVTVSSDPICDEQVGCRGMTLFQICEETTDHLTGYAFRNVRRNGKYGQQWSKSTLDKATALLTAYFYESSHEELEEGLSDKVIETIRGKFAFACVNHKLHDFPGQRTSWYTRAEASVRQYLRSLRSA
jgi:hypothetical protein